MIDALADTSTSGPADSAGSRCSDAQVEPLPGTAKKESVYVVFEWPGGWSHDVLDGGTFGEELTAKLKSKLKGVAGLQLVRRPGRDGRQVGKLHRCYLVWAEQGIMELLLLSGPEAILDLDLTGPGRNGGGPIDTPLILVCTHGRRDVCCAVKGRPLAAALDEVYPSGLVWESSHTKGHRFAPSVIVLPWGYSFGRLNVEAAKEMVARAVDGEMFIPACRGSGLHSPRGQVAELAVATRLARDGEAVRYGELKVGENSDEPAAVTVAHPDGRVWEVTLEKRAVNGVISSCGDAPKAGTAWVATGIAAT